MLSIFTYESNNKLYTLLGYILLLVRYVYYHWSIAMIIIIIITVIIVKPLMDQYVYSDGQIHKYTYI